MKGIHWSVWAALVVLILLVVLLSGRKENYAPPRDENTQPPYTENVGNVATTSNNSPYVESTSNLVVDNQTQIYKDMGGMDFQIQAGNPILNFIQGDPSSNVMYGDFVPNESDGGSARMYAYEDSETITPVPETMQQPSDTLTVSVNASLEPIPENPAFTPVEGIDVNGNTMTTEIPPDKTIEPVTPPDAGQYLPSLTSPTIPFLGDQPGISASESPASMTSPGVTQ
jgi:hypothetical protein